MLLAPSVLQDVHLYFLTNQPQPAGRLCRPLESLLSIMLEPIMLHLPSVSLVKSEIILNSFSHVASCFHCLQSPHIIRSFLPWQRMPFSNVWADIDKRGSSVPDVTWLFAELTNSLSWKGGTEHPSFSLLQNTTSALLNAKSYTYTIIFLQEVTHISLFQITLLPRFYPCKISSWTSFLPCVLVPCHEKEIQSFSYLLGRCVLPLSILNGSGCRTYSYCSSGHLVLCAYIMMIQNKEVPYGILLTPKFRYFVLRFHFTARYLFSLANFKINRLLLARHF